LGFEVSEFLIEGISQKTLGIDEVLVGHHLILVLSIE